MRANPQLTSANAALRAAMKSGRRPNKFGAVRTRVDGYSFDSMKEAKRYGELKLLERGEEIAELRVHPTFYLTVKGHILGRAEFDFSYIDKRSKQRIVEDCKGGNATNTPLSKWKRNHAEAEHGITVRLL